METKGPKLSSTLNNRIDSMVNDDRSRADIISSMASAAGIDSGTVNKILDGEIDCPPLNRLGGFASALGVSAASLRRTAESDGCRYTSNGKAFNCNAEGKSHRTAADRSVDLLIDLLVPNSEK